MKCRLSVRIGERLSEVLLQFSGKDRVMIERRKSPRTEIDSEILVRIRASLEARIVNLSPRGALLELGAPLRPAAECDLRFLETNGDDFKVRARVHRCRLEELKKNQAKIESLVYRAGVEFIHRNEDSCRKTTARLEKLMEDASGSPVQLLLQS